MKRVLFAFVACGLLRSGKVFQRGALGGGFTAYGPRNDVEAKRVHSIEKVLK